MRLIQILVALLLLAWITPGCPGGDDDDDQVACDDDDDAGDDDDDAADDDTEDPGCTGFVLHGTNNFDDAIDLCMVATEDGYVIKGGWAFVSGVWVDDWYEPEIITVDEDMEFVYDAGEDDYLLDHPPFSGSLSVGATSYNPGVNVYLYVSDDGLDLWDVIWAVEPQDSAPDNYPPTLWYSWVAIKDCDSGETLEYTSEHTVGIDQCYAIYFGLSNPDCNWAGGDFVSYEDGGWQLKWFEFEAGELPCSYVDSEGTTYGLWWSSPREEAGEVEFRHRILDGAGASSASRTTTITFVE